MNVAESPVIETILKDFLRFLLCWNDTSRFKKGAYIDPYPILTDINIMEVINHKKVYFIS